MYNKRSGATYKLRAAIKEEVGIIAKLCDDAAYLANENIDWDKIEPFLNYLFDTKQFIQVLETRWRVGRCLDWNEDRTPIL
jgi:hypothetical protein